jgi:hypothetical protein
MSNIWTPSSVVLAATPIFTQYELDRFEDELLVNTLATERDASKFFLKFPKFLFLGRGAEVRHEVILQRTDGSPIQRVDYFRRSFGSKFWDIIELKHPQKPFVVGRDTEHPRLSAHVEEAISQALDYREFIDADSGVRAALFRRGIMVFRPQIVVIVGKHGSEYPAEKLRALYDRITSRGPIEVFSYEDLFEFAKEHYEATQLLMTSAVFAPDSMLVWTEQALTLLYKYYETDGQTSDYENSLLAEAGLIVFRVYADHGLWGYSITPLGCEAMKRKFDVSIYPAPYGFRREPT